MGTAFCRCRFLLIALFFSHNIYVSAQVQQVPITQQGWTTELSLGVDFLSNVLINPAVGAGKNRLGFGAAIDIRSIFNRGRFSWDTNFSLDYAIQKAGSGRLSDSLDTAVPFQKNMDNLWLNSNAAYRTSYFSKYYYAADLFFSSQLTKTYEDNFLSDVTQTGHPISKFLSPAIFQFSLGFEHRPNDYWTIFLSPLSYKNIIVLDDQIADDFATDNAGEFLDGIHGNPLEVDENGDVIFQNYDNQLGTALRIVYENRLSNTFGMSSNLLLFSNYLEKADHIDINFRNQMDLTIVKGLKLSLLSLLTYDHDILVQITDNSRPEGVNGLGRRVSYRQQLLLKYSFVLD
ncbi:MAG: DUF3078 domain-containing protein [Maribacter sp.]|uniref:DUF3078 domain-containing protein n=1 Tax=Maribacter sp. TaxID=1897614 RepID=UPI003C760D68